MHLDRVFNGLKQPSRRQLEHVAPTSDVQGVGSRNRGTSGCFREAAARGGDLLDGAVHESVGHSGSFDLLPSYPMCA